MSSLWSPRMILTAMALGLAAAGTVSLTGAASAAAAEAGPAQRGAPGAILVRDALGARGISIRTPTGRMLRRYRLRGFGVHPGGMAMSPDGSQIAVFAGRVRRRAIPRNGLYLVRVSDGEMRTLIRPRRDLSGLSPPVWSPDGGRILFERAAGQFSVVDVATGAQAPVAFPRLANQTRFSVFFPDGQSLLLGARPEQDSRFANPYQLFRLPLSGAPPVPISPEMQHQAWEADLSPDGNQVAFASATFSNQPPHVWVGPVGGVPRLLADGPRGHRPGLISWSPDGQRLAIRWDYTVPSRRNPSTGFVHSRGEVVGLDGSRTRLRFPPFSASDRLSWSPDSRYLAYDGGPDRGMAVVSPSGRVSRRGFRGSDSPQWIPRRPPPGRGKRGGRLRYRTCMTVTSRRVLRVPGGRRARAAAPRGLRVVTVRRPLCTPWRAPRGARASAAPDPEPAPRSRASQVAPGPGLCSGDEPFKLEGRREWCGRDTLTIEEFQRSGNGPPVPVGQASGSLGARVDLHTGAAGTGQGTYWARIALSSGSGTLRTGARIAYRIRCRALNDTEDCVSNDDVEHERLGIGEDIDFSKTIKVSQGDFRGGTRFHATAWLDFAPDGPGGEPLFVDGFLPTDDIRCNRRGGIGCVYPDFEPTFALPLSDPAVGASADLIQGAQLTLIAAGERSGVFGERPLVREANRSRIRANRRVANRRCRATGPRPAGYDCDEYPFASARLRDDQVIGRWIPRSPNRAAGGRLGDFYRHERVLDEDEFWVRIDP